MVCVLLCFGFDVFFFFKQKTAYEVRISDWSSDVCSSDLINHLYIDGAADPAKAVELAVNAKMRRTGVCGATETILIDRAYGAPLAIIDALVAAGCEVR